MIRGMHAPPHAPHARITEKCSFEAAGWDADESSRTVKGGRITTEGRRPRCRRCNCRPSMPHAAMPPLLQASCRDTVAGGAMLWITISPCLSQNVNPQNVNPHIRRLKRVSSRRAVQGQRPERGGDGGFGDCESQERWKRQDGPSGSPRAKAVKQVSAGNRVGRMAVRKHSVEQWSFEGTAVLTWKTGGRRARHAARAGPGRVCWVCIHARAASARSLGTLEAASTVCGQLGRAGRLLGDPPAGHGAWVPAKGGLGASEAAPAAGGAAKLVARVRLTRSSSGSA